ncbi:hypothetical protein UP10_33300 [Bradyrhizobium sp. LTSPM299]|nr:hypothetical protein UP10_33300 [Bradyrhizobium sp. LTSPM299]
MNRYSTYVSATHLDLARVQPCTQGQADLPRDFTERQSTTNPASGAIEHCQNSVAGAFHQLSSMLLDDLSCQAIMSVKKVAPTAISKLDRGCR